MKIPQTLRSIYENSKPDYERLSNAVDQLIQGRKLPAWHYTSRIKDMQSFALKIETGRYQNPGELEDMFGCTIIVENQTKISEAEKLIRELFDFHNRRPKDLAHTSLRPSSFEFDGLRLYVRWKDSPELPPTGLAGLLFEVQIKTFLQHAWGIATHDLVYKPDELDWNTSRIAYQVKAMLEHAETSIAAAKVLAMEPSLKKEDDETKKLGAVIVWLRQIWKDTDLLPRDLRRLAENLLNLAKVLAIQWEDIKQWTEEATAAGKGAAILNLSPYCIIVKTIFEQPNINEKLSHLKEKTSNRTRVIVPDEAEISIQESHVENILLRIRESVVSV